MAFRLQPRCNQRRPSCAKRFRYTSHCFHLAFPISSNERACVCIFFSHTAYARFNNIYIFPITFTLQICNSSAAIKRSIWCRNGDLTIRSPLEHARCGGPTTYVIEFLVAARQSSAGRCAVAIHFHAKQCASDDAHWTSACPIKGPEMGQPYKVSLIVIRFFFVLFCLACRLFFHVFFPRTLVSPSGRNALVYLFTFLRWPSSSLVSVISVVIIISNSAQADGFV